MNSAMQEVEVIDVTVQGVPVENVQLMTDSTSLLGDPAALLERMSEFGYIYLPGYLNVDEVVEARKVLIDVMNKAGSLQPGTNPMDGFILPGSSPVLPSGRLETLFQNWQAVHRVLYQGPMIEFFHDFLAGQVGHFDFTWTRQMNPGPATPIHADVVYMGRGTHALYTAWTPMGNNGFDLGGLIVLPGSNNHPKLAETYFKQDVDASCENKPNAKAWGKNWGTGGYLHANANQLRRSLNCAPWVTADFKMGDVVFFSVHTLHGGTDNRSNRVRLSTDTRYQLATATMDERWIGADPVGHGPAGKRNKIC